VVSANATDGDGSIARVAFFEGSRQIGESFASPYTVAWSASAAGSYLLTARAYDNLGLSSVSVPIFRHRQPASLPERR
jgi:hypothetical protein